MDQIRVLEDPRPHKVPESYQFEEELEKLELNEEVNIKIDEVFLRGVRHCLSGLEINMKQKIIQSKPTVETIPPEKVEVKETKKRRIFFQ